MKAKDGYGYLLLAVVIVSWGIVPAFAKLGDLPGDLTTMYVNLVATAAVALLISLQGKWKLFRELNVRNYLIMAGLGLAWPLVYSVAYFQSVKEGGAAITTILNYSWPVFALVFGLLINGNRPNKASILGVSFAVAAVAATCLLENQNGINIALPVVLLGLTAAITQGFFHEGNNKWQYDPWVLTFVVEVVTAIGVTAIVLVRGNFMVPSLATIGYLAVIGAISNGVGFWAFIAGGQISKKLSPQWRGTWLIGNCFVPFAQVLLLPILGVEVVSPWKWLGIGLVVVGLVISKLGKK